jgi:F420-non-reducing hydrogenase iron-sulfur subunit
MGNIEPKIIGFLCNWCSYEAADSAGRAGKEYPANFLVIRIMCSGRLDPQFVLAAFREGANGVLILGCHVGDCHYKEGNYHALRRFIMLKKMLSLFGIDEERLRLHWISAGESDRFIEIVSEMVSDIKKLRPLVV